ncbi:MAG: hypothetical protein R3C53_01585 [Pirellulaceae bacterium]
MSIARVENRAPDRYALHHVQLLHPETAQPIATIAKIDVGVALGRWTANVHATQIEKQHFPIAWKLLHNWFICRPSASLHAATFSFDEIRFAGVDHVTSLRDVVLKLLPDAQTLHLELKFQLSDGTEHSSELLAERPRSQLIIKRNHAPSHLSTELQLRTATPLPCSLVTSLVPGVARLGEAATFAGIVNLDVGESTWNMQLINAHLRHVDFSSVSYGTSLGLDGIGEVAIEKANVYPNQIDYAALTVTLDNGGRIGSSLLQSVGHHLSVQVRNSQPAHYHAFDKAAISFCIHPQSLQLAGRLPDGGLFSDGEGNLASRPVELWPIAIPLHHVVDVLDTPARLPNQTRSQLARSALIWLPLEVAPERTASSLRLSRNE